MSAASLADLNASNAAAREAGLTYAAVREILANLQREDDEGISFGRAVEALRELALATAQRLASKEIEERDRLRAECAAPLNIDSGQVPWLGWVEGGAMLDLDPIKARLDAACPGPWTGMTVRRAIDGNCLAIVREHPDGEQKSMKGSAMTVAATLIPQYGDNETAVMLLHSRADMDAMVVEIERLRAENEELRKERPAVVAWLREQDATIDFRPRVWPMAEMIERGEHRREEKTP